MLSKCIKLAAPFSRWWNLLSAFQSSGEMSGAAGLWRPRGIDGQRYRPIAIDDPVVEKANSCNHTAWSNLKWKLEVLDGAESVIQRGNSRFGRNHSLICQGLLDYVDLTISIFCERVWITLLTIQVGFLCWKRYVRWIKSDMSPFFLILSCFIFFLFHVLPFRVCLSAYQRDNWLLILVISRVRLTPIVSIRLPWAINVTSDLSKGAQSPLSPVTAHQNGGKPSGALSPPPSFSSLGVKSHTGNGVLLDTRTCQNR